MILKIKVNPGSKQSNIKKLPDHPEWDYKVSLTAIAENNQANKQLIKQLAEYFNINSSRIAIIKGHTSSVKLIKIDE